MKIKSLNSELLCNAARFNKNVYGKHFQVLKGKEEADKKDYASIMILSLMDERGFFDVVFEQVSRDDETMRGV